MEASYSIVQKDNEYLDLITMLMVSAIVCSFTLLLVIFIAI